jgi:hypothetical protein
LAAALRAGQAEAAANARKAKVAADEAKARATEFENKLKAYEEKKTVDVLTAPKIDITTTKEGSRSAHKTSRAAMTVKTKDGLEVAVSAAVFKPQGLVTRVPDSMIIRLPSARPPGSQSGIRPPGVQPPLAKRPQPQLPTAVARPSEKPMTGAPLIGMKAAAVVRCSCLSCCLPSQSCETSHNRTKP